MIIVGDNSTTKKIDEDIIYYYGISSDILIENVAFKLLEKIDLTKETYLIVVGFGNNGADGYALARLLYALNKDVLLFKVENDTYSLECMNNYKICKNLNIPIITKIEYIEKNLAKIDVVIDAIFGIGLNRNFSNEIKNLINKINYFKEIYKYKVYSIDIPSGLDVNYGNIYNTCIRADETLSIMTYKKGFLNYFSKEFTGEIVIVKDIILNNDKLKKYSSNYVIEKSDLKKLEVKREDFTNKTNYGKVYIVAGSEKYIGAAILTSKASINCGSGYTFLLSDYKELRNSIYQQSELIFESNYNELKNAKVIAIGPGIEYSNKVNEIIDEYKDEKIIIVDAGALSSELSFNSKNILITPHTGEFSRIFNIDLELEKENTLDIVKEVAKEYNINILLKGKNTYITNGEKTYIVNTGNPYMAIGGAGDVLTGMIASFVAQNYSIMEAAIIASYLHGYIADELKKDSYIITPSEILSNISKYLKEIFD